MTDENLTQAGTLDHGGAWASLFRSAAVLGGISLGLVWAHTQSYLLFHSLAELFSIVIGISMFAVAWNSQRFQRDSYLMFLGATFLSVAGLDLIHMLAYKGMGVFPEHGPNLATQLWVAARAMEAVCLASAWAVIGRRFSPWLVLGGLGAIFVLLLASIFAWRVFPVCFVEGVGLTPFKRISEYVICLILLGAIVGLLWRRQALEHKVLCLLVAAMVVTIAQELAFTLYQDPYGAWNLAGHCLKIIAFFLIYKAIVETGLARPYDLLFYDLNNAKLAAEQANLAKDRFIAALSHELRTPLAPVLALGSSLAGDSRMPEDLRQDAEIIRRNVGLEVALIDDLLDVTRIANGKLALDRRPIELAGIIRDAAAICEPDLRVKGHTLTIDTPGAPYLLEGDSPRLHQVFWNLLRNATKFTPPGGRITIKASVSDGAVNVSVSDNGIGIPPAAIPRLFAAFEQGERGSGFGGLGLGLAIAKGVVEMHGGQVSAHSDGPNQGATFTVTFPLIHSSATTASPPQGGHPPVPTSTRPAPRKLRILLVEDHADTARIMARLLAADGHTIALADSVQSAQTAAAASSFDVLMSDLGLPDGSGHDLMRELRSTGNSLPGIALSGYGSAEDVRCSLESGFAEHLTKPVSIESLHAALERIASATPAPAES